MRSRMRSMSEGGPYTYRQDVLDAVWRHGIMPTERTTPELARGFVRDSTSTKSAGCESAT